MSQTVSSSVSVPTSTSVLDVELRDVSKYYGEEAAVQDINLQISEGEFFSILGPSGCGKTTTLRLIAGFEQPTAGSILIEGREMSRIPPYRRPVNTVFQSYALFDHMTVWNNIAFGLRIKRMPRSQLQQQVTDALRLVKMEGFAQRFPRQLSGGQRQRVALARALVNRPSVMLLDEPLGALDLKLRKEMQVELSNLHEQLGITFIMVTHDQEEALSLSDRIAVMRAGNIEQIGSPSEIYDFPKTPFIADFIGDTNLFQGKVDFADNQMLRVRTGQGLTILVRKQNALLVDTQAVVVSVRPEKIHLSQEPLSGDENAYPGILRHMMYMGTHVRCVVELNSGQLLTVMQPSRAEEELDYDMSVYVSWRSEDCIALAAA